MTRVTIALTLAGFAALLVAYFKGVGVIHGGDPLSHMYWATGALVLVAASNLIAIAHLGRAERIIDNLRALCEKNGIEYADDTD
ncbi:MAG TPA: hypothetical protein VEF03_09195 [Candidatus Binataceae bacterium]|nr:hypothetical protein [Candidatus Binataceae bacterium]